MPCRLDARLGSFSPQTMIMSLAGGHQDYEPGAASAETLATAVHEHMHFFQTLMSGYGHVLWDMRRQMTSYVIDEWRKLPCPPGAKHRLPLAHSARLSRAHFAMAIITSETAQAIIQTAKARFFLTDSSLVRLVDLGVALLRQPWELNPSITVNGREHILQGKEILEGQAFFAERTMLSRHFTRDQAWSREGVPEMYTVALDWFVETCGEARRSAFPFVCDLALQATHDPIIPPSENKWRETSPSWRFHQLSQTLAALSSLPFNENSLAEDYERFSGLLLEICGFKSMAQVLEERWTILHRRLPLLGFERLMAHAIEMRRAKPWLAGNPIADEATWAEMIEELPVPAVKIKGGLSRFGGDESLDSEFQFELHYQAFALQLLGDFSGAAVREKSIECGFAKFDIPQGCDYQRTDFCTGRYRPANGPPHEVSLAENGDTSGCPFEVFLRTLGLTSQDLEIDHGAQLPELTDSMGVRQ